MITSSSRENPFSGRFVESFKLNFSCIFINVDTLSSEMVGELNADCRVDFKIQSSVRSRTSDSFYVYLKNCRKPVRTPIAPAAEKLSFQWSQNRNCKLLINGQYSKVVEDKFCAAAGVASHDKSVISYEFSNSGNCKVMINGVYANRNLSYGYSYFCSLRAYNFVASRR